MTTEWKIVKRLERAVSTQEMCENRTSENKRNCLMESARGQFQNKIKGYDVTFWSTENLHFKFQSNLYSENILYTIYNLLTFKVNMTHINRPLES